MNASSQKIYDIRKCPRCGCALFPPYAINGADGDKECGHCKLPIIWKKLDIALEDENRK